jgi:hypothetical protein
MADLLYLFNRGKGLIKRWVDMLDGTWSEQVLAHPPFDLLTDGGTGPNRRIRVDVGQTGFFGGREFRTFRRLNITAGTSVVVKAVVPVDIVLFGLEANIYQGLLDIETVVGGTEGGTFSETLPIFPRNTMSERPAPLYTPVVTLAAGGTHTGGTVLDPLIVKAADNSNFAASVGLASSDERGVGAGTYYFRLSAVSGQGDVLGTFKARWEERLP